jgi:hypothetical protein
MARPKLYESAAERQAAHRARHDTVQLNVAIPREVADALDAYVARQAMDGRGMTKAEVVAWVLRTQLLRKR